MKAILEAKLEDLRGYERKIVKIFDDITDSNEIYVFLRKLEDDHYMIRDKHIGFVCDSKSEYNKMFNRQRIFGAMINIGKDILTCFYDDLLFNDKVHIYLSNDDKLIWVIGKTHTNLWLCDIQFNDAIKYEREIGSYVYVIDLEQGTIEKLDYLI